MAFGLHPDPTCDMRSVSSVVLVSWTTEKKRVVGLHRHADNPEKLANMQAVTFQLRVRVNGKKVDEWADRTER